MYDELLPSVKWTGKPCCMSRPTTDIQTETLALPGWVQLTSHFYGMYVGLYSVAATQQASCTSTAGGISHYLLSIIWQPVESFGSIQLTELKPIFKANNIMQCFKEYSLNTLIRDAYVHMHDTVLLLQLHKYERSVIIQFPHFHITRFQLERYLDFHTLKKIHLNRCSSAILLSWIVTN